MVGRDLSDELFGQPSALPAVSDRKQRFLDEYGSMAAQVAEELGVDPKLILAQWAHESAWGRSPVGKYNIANIKDVTGKGTRALDKLEGSYSAYKDYASPEEAAADYARLLRTRYPNVMGTGSDAAAFAQGLRSGVRGSYATDPNYEQKLKGVYQGLGGVQVPQGGTTERAGRDLSSELFGSAPSEGRDLSAELFGSAQRESTIGSEAKRSFKQLASSTTTALDTLFGKTPEEAAKLGIKRGEEISAEAGAGPSWAATKEAYEREGLWGGAKEAISQIPRAVAGQAGNLAAMYAGGKSGALLGAAIPIPGAAPIGAGIGAALAIAPSVFGSQTERQAAEQTKAGKPVDIDVEKALLSTAGQTALEAGGTYLTLGKGLIGKLLGITQADDAARKALVATAQQSISKTLAGGAVRGTAEIPVEVAQSVLERWQAGLDVLSPEAYAEYGESAYQAGLVGPTLGSVANVQERRSAQSALRAEDEAQQRLETEQRVLAKQAERAQQAEARTLAEAQEQAVEETEPTVRKTAEEVAAQPEEATFPPLEPEVPEPTLRPKNAMKAEAFDIESVHPAVTPELGPTTYNWANKAGRKWVESIAAMPQEEALAQRKALVGRSQQKADIFDAIHAQPTPSTAYVEPDIRLEPEGQRPTAEPGVEPPAGPTGQPGFGDQYPERTEALDGAGVAPDRGLAGEQPGADVQQPAALETQPTAEPVIYGPETTETVEAETQGPQAPTEPALGIDQESYETADAAERKQRVDWAAEDQAETAADIAAIDEAVQAYNTMGEPGPSATNLERSVFRRNLLRQVHNIRRLAEDQGVLDSVRDYAQQKLDDEVLPEHIEAARREVLYNIESLTSNRSVYAEEAKRSPSLRREIAGLQKRLDAGAISADEFANRVEWAMKGTKKEREAKPRERGADYIRQRLLEAKRRGDLSEEGVNLAEWFIQKNPALVDDLAISIRSAKEEGTSGSYDPLYRLMTLIKESEKDGTTVHEILHHLERMMPAQVQTKIRADWLKALTSELRKAAEGSKERQVLESILDYHLNGSRSSYIAAMKLLKNGEVAYDLYQYTNPSEFWAVNATDIVARRYAASASVAGVIKNWLRELGQKIKALFGLRSEAPLIRALDSLMRADGKFQSQRMLSEGDGVASDIAGKTKPDQTLPQGESSVSDKELASAITRSSQLMQEQKGPVARAVQTMVDAFSDAQGIGWGDKLRNYLVDNMAVVTRRFNTNLFDGKVRTELGLVNPLVQMRQAQDHQKMLETFFETGGLTKSQETGVWTASKVDGVPAIKDMYDAVKAWADTNKAPFDTALAEISKRMEAIRLNAMREANAANPDKETHFPIHKLSQAAGTPDADTQIDTYLRVNETDPIAQQVLDMMDNQRKAMIDHMVSVGRISAEQAGAWKEAAGYVPFDRFRDPENDVGDAFRASKTPAKGLAKYKDLAKFVGTTQREVGNVLDNHVQLMSWMIGETLKTDATRTAVRLLADMGSAQYAGKYEAIRPDDRNRAVAIMSKGEKQWFVMPSVFDAMAFREMSVPKSELVRWFGKFSHLLRSTITLLPPFTARQVAMDIQRAMGTSGVENPHKLVMPILGNFFRLATAELMGKRHADVTKFGANAMVGDYDLNTYNPMHTLMREFGYKPRTAVQKLLHKGEGILRASDLAVRKAIYDQTLVETKSETYPRGDVLLAEQRAREFINFRRQGSAVWTRAILHTVPFANATLQGLDVLYRAATGRDSSTGLSQAQARSMFWNRMAVMAGFSALYALMVGDDDEYKDMDLRKRHGHWVLPGLGVIPVPPELAALSKVPAEMLLEMLRREGTPEQMVANEASITALKYAFEQFVGNPVGTLVGLPVAIRPVVEALTNRSFFTGGNIVPTAMKDIRPGQQSTTATSELAKAIAKFSESVLGDDAVSPVLVDHFLNSYFGTTAALVTAQTDALLNPDRLDRPAHKMFMASVFLYDPIGTRKVQEFWDARDKAIPRLRTYQKMLKDNNPAAQAYFDKHLDDIMLAQEVNTKLATLTQIQKGKQFVQSDLAAKSGMTKEERQRDLDMYRRQEQELGSWLRETRAFLDSEKRRQ